MTEFRSRVFKTASVGAVENLGWGHRKLYKDGVKDLRVENVVSD